mgnify:CR=1 FL=1
MHTVSALSILTYKAYFFLGFLIFLGFLTLNLEQVRSLNLSSSVKQRLLLLHQPYLFISEQLTHLTFPFGICLLSEYLLQYVAIVLSIIFPCSLHTSSSIL